MCNNRTQVNGIAHPASRDVCNYIQLRGMRGGAEGRGNVISKCQLDI